MTMGTTTKNIFWSMESSTMYQSERNLGQVFFQAFSRTLESTDPSCVLSFWHKGLLPEAQPF
jgi:hypothetical protein